MLASLDDTIAAVASAAGSAARGIIRIGGANVQEVVSKFFSPSNAAAWNARGQRPARYAGCFTLPSQDEQVPVDLYLWSTSRSYTGQPLVELHTIGSPPLLEAMLGVLYEEGARPARPGEFTLRAFLAGRVDLVQAEAVLGVIDADDHNELNLALSQLAGGISTKITLVHADLLELLADLEAGLDFADEDLEFVDIENVQRRIHDALKTVEELVDQADHRSTSSTARRVVLAGLPNAGKSTLFNTLVGVEGALVSDVRGTTRDYLKARVEWDGKAIELIDTAGWEINRSGIMSIAQQLRDEQFQQADLIVWCTAMDSEASNVEVDRQLRVARQSAIPSLFLATKADLGVRGELASEIAISAKTGHGIPEFKQAVLELLARPHRGERQLLGTTAARCRQSLHAAMTSLATALAAANEMAGNELVSMELRETLEHLGQIVGSVYTDDILDRIFSKFCIGK